MKNITRALTTVAVFWSGAIQAVPTDYTITFDFSDAPVLLAAGEYPLFVDVDFGMSFASYEDLFVTATLGESVKHVTTHGVILSGPGPYPSYAAITPWGAAVMTGSSQSVTPSNYFSWNSGWGSEHWTSYDAEEISNEILDGQFRFYLQNAPLEITPSLSSRESFSVQNLEVTLRGAEMAAPVPEPSIYATMLVSLGIVGLAWRRQNGRIRRYTIMPNRRSNEAA